MRANVKVLHAYKQILNSGLVKEINIWEVPESKDYPEGLKYRLVIAEPVWKKVLILFDNHTLKGHHWHGLNKNEHEYKFVSLEFLMEDFFNWEKFLEKEYENNENQNSK